MDYYHHARLTVIGREELAKRVLEGRLSLKAAEAEFKLSRQSAAKCEPGAAAVTAEPHPPSRAAAATQPL